MSESFYWGISVGIFLTVLAILLGGLLAQLVRYIQKKRKWGKQWVF